MSKNQVTDLITDQERVFARLILSGTMTDRQAAVAAGLNPDTAACTKAKPCVHAYMLEHRAAVQQQFVEQDIDEESRLKQRRKRVLARLWEIAELPPESTRNSASAQVKALAMIAAIEGLIPDRRAASAKNKPAPPPVKAEIYQPAWLRQQRENPPPAPAQPEAAPQPQPASELAGSPPVPQPAADLTGSTVSAGPSKPAQTVSRVPRVPGADFVAPHTRIPFIWHR